VRLRGVRIEEALPGRQGRLFFAYLVAHRHQPLPRHALIDALWPNGAPAAADNALSALLTKLRSALGNDVVVGKHEVSLVLPANAWVDLEAAPEALHRAEAAVAREDWLTAWGPSRVALYIALRSLLPGYDAAWLDERRRNLNDILLRAHECVAAAGVALGGPELASASRSARALTKLAPFRESGHRLLMQVLAAEGNVAEALLTYENLRTLLRDELGVAPGVMTQAIHKRLLQP
jgi:DNA-binding SARP family transcriptional activator